MITAILSIIWLLLIICVIVAVGVNSRKKGSYDFQNFGIVDVPYVTVDIQGKEFNMIVDTACGASIMHTKSLMDSEIEFQLTGGNLNFSSLTNESVNTKAVVVEFELNGMLTSEIFYLYDSDTNFGDFSERYGITIHGLIGSDFLEAHKCKVDYATHKLTVK